MYRYIEKHRGLKFVHSGPYWSGGCGIDQRWLFLFGTKWQNCQWHINGQLLHKLCKDAYTPLETFVFCAYKCNNDNIRQRMHATVWSFRTRSTNNKKNNIIGIIENRHHVKKGVLNCPVRCQECIDSDCGIAVQKSGASARGEAECIPVSLRWCLRVLREALHNVKGVWWLEAVSRSALRTVLGNKHKQSVSSDVLLSQQDR